MDLARLQRTAAPFLAWMQARARVEGAIGFDDPRLPSVARLALWALDFEPTLRFEPLSRHRPYEPSLDLAWAEARRTLRPPGEAQAPPDVGHALERCSKPFTLWRVERKVMDPTPPALEPVQIPRANLESAVDEAARALSIVRRAMAEPVEGFDSTS